MSEFDKFGEAIGLWQIDIDGVNLDLKPKMGDNRKFRKIIMNENYKKDRGAMFDKFEEFMLGMIRRDYPPATDEDKNLQDEFVEFNVNKLFEEVMVKFRWTTRDELEKSKKETVSDLKKSIGAD